jgi:hypothetical protein
MRNRVKNFFAVVMISTPLMFAIQAKTASAQQHS